MRVLFDHMHTLKVVTAPTCPYALSPVLTRITPNVVLRSVYRSFSHDVTTVIFVYKTMNQRPCFCKKKILWELNSFHMLKLFFIPSNLQSC